MSINKVGTSCNTAIVMAKLELDGVDHGLHGFMVQLRCEKTHKPFSSFEIFFFI